MSKAVPVDELGRLIAKGAGWVIALRFAVRLLGLVSTVILARLLMPADFGIIALATVIAGGLELLGAFNFEAWLIRHPDAKTSHYDTVWTLSVIRGICTSLLVMALAIPASNFFDDDRLVYVLLILSLASALAAFRNVGIVEYQKHLQFEREFVLFFAAKIGAFVVTVGLAIILQSYWALLAGIVTGRLLKLYLSYRLHSYRPTFSLQYGREVFDFSKWLLTGSIFGYLYTKSSTFIVGKFLGNQALGIFTVAQELANLPSTELLMPLRRVLMPAYSNIKHDLPRLRASFVETLTLIMLIGLPIVAGIGLVAEPLVWVVLGERWLEAIPLLQVLVFYGLTSICIANQGPMLIALGHTRMLSNLYGLGLLILVPTVIVAADMFGVIGVAYAIAIVNFLLLLVSLKVTLGCIELSFSGFVLKIWRVLLSVVLMSVSVYFLQSYLGPFQFGHFTTLLMSALTGVLTYVTVMIALWLLSGAKDGAERTLIDFIRNAVAQRKFSVG